MDTSTETVWHQMWQDATPRFHLGQVHPKLVQYAEKLLSERDHRVLVPLCGKSLDVLWLEEQGHEVGGFELVEEGVRRFHEEHGRTADIVDMRPFRVWLSGTVQIFQGDFLAAEPEITGLFTACWDRGSLVALPPERRVVRRKRLKQHALVGVTVAVQPDMRHP